MLAKIGKIQQPPLGCKIDWSNPLTKDLKACVIINDTLGHAHDLYKPRRNSSGSGTTKGPYGLGCGWNIGTDEQDLDFTSGPFTILTFVNIISAPSAGHYAAVMEHLTYSSESVNAGWHIQLNGDSGKFAFGSLNNNSSSSYNLSSTTSTSAGQWVIVGTSDGTTRRIYVNGTQEATTTNSPNPASAHSAGGAGLDNFTDGNTHYVYASYAWSRVLSAKEIQDLYLNPYALVTTKKTLKNIFGSASPNITVAVSRLNITSSTKNPTLPGNKSVLASQYVIADEDGSGTNWALRVTDGQLNWTEVSSGIVASVNPIIKDSTGSSYFKIIVNSGMQGQQVIASTENDVIILIDTLTGAYWTLGIQDESIVVIPTALQRPNALNITATAVPTAIGNALILASTLGLTSRTWLSQAQAVWPRLYNRFKANIFSGLFDANASGRHNISVVLLNSSYTFNPRHNTYGDVVPFEVTGTGYTAGGTSLGVTSVSQDNTNNVALFTASNTAWNNATITSRYAILYDNTLVHKDLIGCIDFQKNYSSQNETFQLNWNSNGIVMFT